MLIPNAITLDYSSIISEASGALISGAILLSITLFVQNRNFKKQIEFDEIKEFQKSDFFKKHIKSMNIDALHKHFIFNLQNYDLATKNFELHYNYSNLFFEKYRKFFVNFTFNNQKTSILTRGHLNNFYYIYRSPSSKDIGYEEHEMYIIFNTLVLNKTRDEQTILLNDLLDEIDNNISSFSSHKIHSFLNLYKCLVKPERKYYLPDNMGDSNFYRLIKDFQIENPPLIIDYFSRDLAEFNMQFHSEIETNLYKPVCLKITGKEYSVLMRAFNELILSESNKLRKNSANFSINRKYYSAKFENNSIPKKLRLLKQYYFLKINNCSKSLSCYLCTKTPKKYKSSNG